MPFAAHLFVDPVIHVHTSVWICDVCAEKCAIPIALLTSTHIEPQLQHVSSSATIVVVPVLSAQDVIGTFLSDGLVPKEHS